MERSRYLSKMHEQISKTTIKKVITKLAIISCHNILIITTMQLNMTILI